MLSTLPQTGIQTAARGSTDAPTKSQLIIRIEAVRERIDDMTVSFRYDADSASPNNLFARSHRLVALKGTNIRMEHVYSGMNEEREYSVLAAFDGTRSSVFLKHLQQAYVENGLAQVLETKGVGFFDVMAWNPFATDSLGGSGDMDLVSVLTSPMSSVRRTTELINGRPCVVVEERESVRGPLTYVAWVDPSWGHLPIRQQYVDGATGKPLMEFLIDEAKEVGPGVWLPIRGRKVLYPGHGNAKNVVHVLEVDGITAGEARIHVNGGVANSVFSVLPELPVGTLLGDLQTGRRWIVTTTALKETGAGSRSNGSSGTPGNLPDRVLRAQVPWTWVVGAAAAVGAVLIGGVAVVRRMRRQNVGDVNR